MSIEVFGPGDKVIGACACSANAKSIENYGDLGALSMVMDILVLVL